ncbi:MAG: efflux RND transporter periplasmic adaptor subunit [Thermoanaerobaculia bacterium]
MNRILKSLAILLLLVTACSRDQEHTDETAPEREALSYTSFQPASELFVEFKALAVGAESPFAAHVTKLDDFKPATEGTVSAILSGGSAPEERFAVSGVASPGIFRPIGKPAYAGARNLRFEIEAHGFRDVHDLGVVTVHHSLEAAIAAAPKDEEGGGGTISYLKEQQWKTDFATAPVGTARMRASVEASAELRPTADGAASVAAPAAGRIIAGRFPQIGTLVARNAVLAQIAPNIAADIDLASLQLDADRARLAAAQAEMEQKRVEELFAQEAVAERRVIDARARAATARAELRAAETRLAQFHGTQTVSGQGAADRIALRAPIAGVITAVHVAPGSAVAAGTVVFEIVNLERLLLEVHVPEAEFARLRNATGAAFYPQGFTEPVEITPEKGGRLVAFGGVVDQRTRTIPLVFELANRDNALRAGMSGRALVYTGAATNALAIPLTAVVEENAQPVAYVEVEGESFERRALKLGAHDGALVQVLSGLAAGERVVTRGAYDIRLASASGAVPAHGHAHRGRPR